MANEIPLKWKTPIVWANASFSNPDLTRTHAMDMSALVDAAARQGAKADLGALAGQLLTLYARFPMAAAPASRSVVDSYLGYSPSATAGNLNPGGLTGTDAAYTGTTGDDIDDSVAQLLGAYPLICTADTGQVMVLAQFTPKLRYLSPVVVNRAGVAFATGNDAYLAITPSLPELQ